MRPLIILNKTNLITLQFMAQQQVPLSKQIQNCRSSFIMFSFRSLLIFLEKLQCPEIQTRCGVMTGKLPKLQPQKSFPLNSVQRVNSAPSLTTQQSNFIKLSVKKFKLRMEGEVYWVKSKHTSRKVFVLMTRQFGDIQLIVIIEKTRKNNLMIRKCLSLKTKKLKS